MSNISRDIPNELKAFWKIFEKLSYRHQYANVFEDYLTLCLFNFSLDEPEYKAERDQRMKNYTPEEHQLFNELFFEMIRVFEAEIVMHNKAWFDFFGDLYQTISSNHKSQAMGQFFTPECVVDMMALMQNIQPSQTVSDPCCGSGRMLLAAHAHSKGCYVFGQDLDLICCKMTVLNMVLHGCNGEVVWCNSLDLYDYKRGWRIKPVNQHFCGIIPMPKEESFIWEMNEARIEEFTKTKESAVKVELKEKYPDTLFPDMEPIHTERSPSKKSVTVKLVIAEPIYQEELF